ncbi:hypothetical protein L6164_003381 [Bauhinia variegata]|uniref:Uncharacterized protein n=1 Tax=Bauhinia variegata TaxID=167791 RepID=A0ACB9Q1B1_BAUVA|nr:hypothetical protein L6164_003381 [Bauhinia variegata]
MASLAPLQSTIILNNNTQKFLSGSKFGVPLRASNSVSWSNVQKNSKSSSTVVAAVGDVAADSNIYLIAGAIGVALVGTAFPILFSRKDTCPECDGAGFVRKAGVTLRANAARKDQAQIVCPRCSGLGKLNQIDK